MQAMQQRDLKWATTFLQVLAEWQPASVVAAEAECGKNEIEIEVDDECEWMMWTELAAKLEELGCYCGGSAPRWGLTRYCQNPLETALRAAMTVVNSMHWSSTEPGQLLWTSLPTPLSALIF